MQPYLRWTHTFFAGVLFLAVHGYAAPDDDYAAALKSYQAGDVVGAMPGLRKAANGGHAKAQVLLAELLDRSEFDEEAVGYYRKAAEQGDADGMFGYAVMLAAGEGLKKKDPLEARRWFLRAAEAGHAQATNVLAQAYLKGELGFVDADRESPEALRWIERAALNDYLPAIDALSEAYRTGRGLPVAADEKLAAEFLARSNRLRGIDPAKKKRKGRKNVVVQPDS